VVLPDFAAIEKENRIKPAKSYQQFDKDNIECMALFGVRPFVKENGFGNKSTVIIISVGKNVPSKTVRYGFFFIQK
jgi:hypothetical protein